MLQIQYIASNITIVDQTLHVCASFQALNKPSGYITLRRHHDVKTARKKLETLFFRNRIHFSTRKCMFDTFTQKFPRDYTAAYTKRASASDFQQCGMCDQQSLRSACAYAQSDQSLCSSLEYSMIVKLLIEHN